MDCILAKNSTCQEQVDLIESQINFSKYICVDSWISQIFISSNEQYIAIILERGYNNVELEHYLTLIFDDQTQNFIFQGRWISVDLQQQKEFDNNSKYFVEVTQNMVSLIDLKKKQHQINLPIDNIENFYFIDNNNNIYLNQSSFQLIKYSIDKQEIIYCYYFQNYILNCRSFSKYILIMLQINDQCSICIYSMNNFQKLREWISQIDIVFEKANQPEIFIVRNQFYIEKSIINLDGLRVRNIYLRKICGGKIIRKVQNILLESIFQIQQQDVVQDNILQEENQQLSLYDLVRGIKKSYPFVIAQKCSHYEICHFSRNFEISGNIYYFSKNSFLYELNKSELRYIRIL